MGKLVIIDSYALIHRAYHALPPLVSPGGILVNGVYGFMLVFLKMIEELKPSYLVACFDLAKPTFRHEQYKDYKAKRVKAPENFYDQINILKEILRAWEIPILEKEGYEADDVIGAIVEKLKKEKIEIAVLTGDLDTLQLVSDQVSIYTLKRGLQDRIIYGPFEVEKRYALKPSQLIDFKALKGDPSDNIPGVAGVGEKTSQKLIQEFNNLDNLYKQIEEGKTGSLSAKIIQKLKENKEQAYFSRHLVSINREAEIDVDLESSWFKPPKEEKLKPILKKLGFESLIARIFSFSGEKNKISEKALIKEIKGEKEISQVKEKISFSNKFGLVLDYEGEKYLTRTIKGLYFIFENKLFYLPKSLFFSFFGNFDLKDWQDKTIFTHRAKVLAEEIEELSSVGFEDLEIFAWLIDSERKNYDLESLARSFLKKETGVSFEEHLASFILLGENLRNKVLGLGLNNIWENIEKPMIGILAGMEKNGILADKEKIEDLRKKAEKEISDLEEKIYELCGKKLNLNSPQQLSAVLFEDLKIPFKGLRKTPSGKISTDILELMKIKDFHPAVSLIVQHRQLEKLRNSFLDTLPDFINPKTKRIHPVWKQTGTATGRLSCQLPNLQNIPIKGEWGKAIRSAFRAEESNSLLALDYSQIELRLAAHLSLDPKMISVFREDKDIHTLTAAYIHDVSEDKVTPEMRQLAKTLNFGIIYGMGDKAFSETAGIPLEKAKMFREEYFREFSGLKSHLDFSLERAKKLGYAETIFGRKRFLPLIGSLNRQGKQEERIALNMPIQGLAADIIKMAMIKIGRLIKEKNPSEEIKFLIQVHDELILEGKSAIINEMSAVFKEIMENAVKLEIPLKAEAKIGFCWSELE